MVESKQIESIFQYSFLLFLISDNSETDRNTTAILNRSDQGAKYNTIIKRDVHKVRLSISQI